MRPSMSLHLQCLLNLPITVCGVAEVRRKIAIAGRAARTIPAGFKIRSRLRHLLRDEIGPAASVAVIRALGKGRRLGPAYTVGDPRICLSLRRLYMFHPRRNTPSRVLIEYRRAICRTREKHAPMLTRTGTAAAVHKIGATEASWVRSGVRCINVSGEA